MRIYIAGKITGYDNYKEDFERAAKRLAELGAEPIIPYEYNEGELTYKEYIDNGLKLLGECDAIYMLDNWSDSNGAILEYMYACTIGIKMAKIALDTRTGEHIILCSEIA